MSDIAAAGNASCKYCDIIIPDTEEDRLNRLYHTCTECRKLLQSKDILICQICNETPIAQLVKLKAEFPDLESYESAFQECFGCSNNFLEMNCRTVKLDSIRAVIAARNCQVQSQSQDQATGKEKQSKRWFYNNGTK